MRSQNIRGYNFSLIKESTVVGIEQILSSLIAHVHLTQLQSTHVYVQQTEKSKYIFMVAAKCACRLKQSKENYETECINDELK